MAYNSSDPVFSSTRLDCDDLEQDQTLISESASRPASTKSSDSNTNLTTRKRKLDDSDSRANKRSHFSEESSEKESEVYFKLLIPKNSAGGVIGKGGEKIGQIQKDSSVRMKMSKANDFYPNTCERICLIIGSTKGVLKAHDFIVERMQEKQQTDSNIKSDPEMTKRLNQVLSFLAI